MASMELDYESAALNHYTTLALEDAEEEADVAFKEQAAAVAVGDAPESAAAVNPVAA